MMLGHALARSSPSLLQTGANEQGTGLPFNHMKEIMPFAAFKATVRHRCSSVKVIERKTRPLFMHYGFVMRACDEMEDNGIHESSPG